MRLNKKITATAIFSLFALSMFSAMQPVAAASSVEDAIGHKFTEEYWSVIYDFAGQYLEKDYNPGSYASSLGEGLTDNNTGFDANFFLAWNNIQNVQSLYVGFQNSSYDASNSTLYGCAPYQLMLQHFRPPGQAKIHVFAVNTFFGLLAWRDNLTAGTQGIPDQEDNLYMGWAYFSELHKSMVNTIFWTKGVNRSYWIDNTSRGYADPIPMTKTVVGNNTTYKYGMSYKNIFLLWQKIEVTEGLDDSVDEAAVINNCSAFGIISELNFTNIISYNESKDFPGLTEVTTTTEYDIGPMNKLWVLGDNHTVSDYFNGNRTEISNPDVNVTYYAGDSIMKRLGGNASLGFAPFGLAVVNHANLIVIDLSKPYYKYDGDTDFVDSTNATLGASDKAIGTAMYNITANNTAYKIDFASKPTYTLNGGTAMNAPTRVLRNNAIKDPLGPLARLFVFIVLGAYILNITEEYRTSLPAWQDFLYSSALLVNVIDQLANKKFFYLTCFPKWENGQIAQDPTFTAYIETPTNGGGLGIPGYEPFIVGLTSIAGVSIIYLGIKRKKKVQIY